LIRLNSKTKGDVYMKAKRNHFRLALLLAALCGHSVLSQATPIGGDTLDYRGAVFSLDSGWDGSRYLITYRANFSGFQGDQDQSYLKAIDWSWVNGDIGTVTLTAAPGDLSNWVAQTNQQIGLGDSPECEAGGGSDAVCTQFVGSDQGFSTFGSSEDLTWVFEIGFKEFRQREVLFEGGFGAAVIGSGKLTDPVMSCLTAQNPACADQRLEIEELSDDNGSVPSPGVPALLAVGFAGMLLRRRLDRCSDV
jgi:hypothetical protein